MKVNPHLHRGAAVLIALLIAGVGCGSDDITSSTLPTAPAGPTAGALPELRLTSPAVNGGTAFKDAYPCRTTGNWLPLQWSEPPAGTEELVLMTTRFEQSVRGNSALSTLKAISMVQGLPADLRRLERESLPPHASSQYYRFKRFCPAHDGQFLFQIFAMPSTFAGARKAEGLGAVEKLFELALARGELQVAYSGKAR